MVRYSKNLVGHMIDSAPEGAKDHHRTIPVVREVSLQLLCISYASVVSVFPKNRLRNSDRDMCGGTRYACEF